MLDSDKDGNSEIRLKIGRDWGESLWTGCQGRPIWEGSIWIGKEMSQADVWGKSKCSVWGRDELGTLRDRLAIEEEVEVSDEEEEDVCTATQVLEKVLDYSE